MNKSPSALRNSAHEGEERPVPPQKTVQNHPPISPAAKPRSADEQMDLSDEVDIASMDSFPCSDPPAYYSMRT